MNVSILFHEPQAGVTVSGRHGQVSVINDQPMRLNLETDQFEIGYVADATVVSVAGVQKPFSFFLRDVRKDFPIYIPDCGAIVTSGDDDRSYEFIESSILSRGLKSSRERIEGEPEWSFESAAEKCRKQRVPTWLGLSRDIRIFEVDNDDPEAIRYIYPKYHWRGLFEDKYPNRRYGFWFDYGRGCGCSENEERRLYNGTLPILSVIKRDNDIEYTQTIFVSLEKSPLSASTNRGTHSVVADAHASYMTMFEKHQRLVDEIKDSEINRPEETVLYMRLEAVNKGDTPDYSFFIMPGINKWYEHGAFGHETVDNGFLRVDGEVYAVGTIDGKPITRKELSAMIFPGEKITVDIKIPHRFISDDRAAALLSKDYDTKLNACIDFWNGKLASAGKFNIPESRIDEMTKAGLLHLDLISYGIEPNEPISACVGGYSCIGTESAPIIMYYDSVGWHRQAARCLEHFLTKQQDDGLILNFSSYMSETGAILWTIGEHYKYTRDAEWIRGLKSQILKSCDYIIRWRERNKIESLRGKGYGLIEGQVADPEDPYHIYFLNAHACEALRRIGETLRDIDPIESDRLLKEADEFRADLLTAINENMANSPVAPLKDGTWCRTLPSWTEADAPCYMYTTDASNYSHGGFVLKDSLIGPLYLTLTGNLHSTDPITESMMRVNADLLSYDDAPISQPYYSQQNYSYLVRGETKPFLKSYYNMLAGLADRETYTFWEHYYHVSPHKTHEESWFLMQTRWMHYLEDGDKLNLFPGIPGKWLEDGEISAENMASYFGNLSFSVKKSGKRIAVRVQLVRSACRTNSMSESLEIAYPSRTHPRVKSGATGSSSQRPVRRMRLRLFALDLYLHELTARSDVRLRRAVLFDKPHRSL